MKTNVDISVLCMFALLLAWTGCTRGNGKESIFPEDLDLQAGDIVFRRGTGATSQLVVASDIEGKYSHVGLVALTDSGLMIVHAVPDEPDFPGDPDRVKVERPQVFFSKYRAKCGAVGRPADTMASATASRLALREYAKGTLFDHEYSEVDTVKLYCCQLVTKTFASAGLELTPVGTHYTRFPGVINSYCTFPSDIYNSQKIRILRTF